MLLNRWRNKMTFFQFLKSSEEKHTASHLSKGLTQITKFIELFIFERIYLVFICVLRLGCWWHCRFWGGCRRLNSSFIQRYVLEAKRSLKSIRLCVISKSLGPELKLGGVVNIDLVDIGILQSSVEVHSQEVGWRCKDTLAVAESMEWKVVEEEVLDQKWMMTVKLNVFWLMFRLQGLLIFYLYLSLWEQSTVI